MKNADGHRFSIRSIAAIGMVWWLAACGGDDAIARGGEIFAADCAVCHGADARGGGGASVPGLGRTPADLTVLAAQNGGDFPVLRVASVLEDYAMGTQSGRRMRPFVRLRSDRRRGIRTQEGRQSVAQPMADILLYLETLQRP